MGAYTDSLNKIMQTIKHTITSPDSQYTADQISSMYLGSIAISLAGIADALVEGKYDNLIDYLSQFDESDAVKVKYIRQKVEEAVGKKIDWYEKRR